jgi:hypothetical protein
MWVLPEASRVVLAFHVGDAARGNQPYIPRSTFPAMIWVAFRVTLAGSGRTVRHQESGGIATEPTGAPPAGTDAVVWAAELEFWWAGATCGIPSRTQAVTPAAMARSIRRT